MLSFIVILEASAIICRHRSASTLIALPSSSGACFTSINCQVATGFCYIYAMSMQNNTDEDVPNNALRSPRSDTYCRKRAVIQAPTQLVSAVDASAGKHDRRNLTCGPRPQPAARSIPCRTPCAGCRETIPLSKCTQRAATARPAS